MKNKLKDFIYNLNYKFLLKNEILLESVPDYCDNPKGVFDEMIKQKINDKYKIIWFVEDQNKFKNIKIKNVKFITRNSYFKLRFLYHNLFAKYIVDCNKCIRKRNKYQLRIYLSHGTPIKIAKEYCKAIGKVDYIIQVSDFFSEINTNLFGLDSEHVITTGLPRNDLLMDKKIIINDYFPDIKRNKTILWFPTYRNHKNKSSENKKSYFPFGLPTINTKRELVELNNYLKEKAILLLINFHPAEDTSKILEIELSNIKIIDNQIFEKDHSSLYHLLKTVNAYITDYSSTYYDSLLLNIPIGLAIPDIKTYKKNNGFIFDKYEDGIIGEYIYNFSDLKHFINNVSDGKDVCKLKRNKAKKIYNKYLDNNSANRVLEILKEKMRDE